MHCGFAAPSLRDGRGPPRNPRAPWTYRSLRFRRLHSGSSLPGSTNLQRARALRSALFESSALGWRTP